MSDSDWGETAENGSSLQEKEEETLKSAITSNFSWWDPSIEEKVVENLKSGKWQVEGDEIELAIANACCTTELLEILVANKCEVTYENIEHALESKKCQLLLSLLTNADEEIRMTVADRKPHILVDVLMDFAGNSNSDGLTDLSCLLVEGLKVDINLKHSPPNESSTTALILAITYHSDELFDYFLAQPNIDVNLSATQLESDKTPLQKAFDCGRFSLAEKLICAFASFKSLQLENVLCSNGFTKAFSLLYTLGYEFDLEALRTEQDFVGEVNRELEYFQTEWIMSDTTRVKSLKELSAVTLRKNMNTKAELDELLNMCQWCQEIKNLLQLNHVDPEIPPEFSERCFANADIYGFGFGSDYDGDGDFFENEDDFYNDSYDEHDDYDDDGDDDDYDFYGDLS